MATDHPIPLNGVDVLVDLALPLADDVPQCDSPPTLNLSLRP